MKIIHLIPKLNSGGAEKQLFYLSNELTYIGYEVHIIYLYGTNDIYDNTKIFLHKLTTKKNFDPRLIVQVIKIIKKIKPNIINTWILQMDIVGGISALICNIPFILREPSSKGAYNNSWKNRFRIFIGKKANAIIANSNGGVDYWKEHIPNKIIYKIPNGLPIEEIISVTPSLPNSLKKIISPIILYVGRLASDKSASKNLINLLKVISQINNSMSINCIICGDGPQKDELQKVASELNIYDKVYFFENIESNKVWSIMKSADLFISLSDYEGCPNSVLEAMFCGCDMVLSDIDAHREILKFNEVIFVNQNDIESIATSIINFIKKSKENKINSINFEKSQWNIKNMTKSYNNVYIAHKNN